MATGTGPASQRSDGRPTAGVPSPPGARRSGPVPGTGTRPTAGSDPTTGTSPATGRRPTRRATGARPAAASDPAVDADARPAAHAPPGAVRRSLVVVAALVVLAGLGLRAYVWSTALGEPDLDEATVGVQAEAFLDGDVAVFFPNQASGGTLETGLVAVAFAVLGTSTFVLKLVPVALAVAATALTWRAARRVVPSRLGQWCVPALMWCWPASAVLFSTKERGFYGVALVLAAAIVLLVLRLDAEPTARDIVLVGLCLGLGWWTTPLSLLVAVPALAWLIARHPALVRATRPVALAALAAGLPWILHNVTHGFSSLEAPSGFGTSWADRTGDFLDKLPIVAGLETPWDPDRRLLPWSLAPQAVVVVVVVVATLRTRRRAPGLLATILVGYGVLYGLNGLVAGVGGDPRYLYPLLPVLALSVGSLIPDPVPAASDHLVGAGIVV